ncbi:hypothetical protein Barb7_03005 [Bacteroidales bacterium Barb7]|nr:hypothetical protein Barb7_03005 [Bacteroidales bacterium Barb7]
MYLKPCHFSLQRIDRIVHPSACFQHLIALHFRHGIAQGFLLARNTQSRHHYLVKVLRIGLQHNPYRSLYSRFLRHHSHIGNHQSS